MAETRIRIICHLPNNNARQAFVVHKVFAYLKKMAVNRHWRFHAQQRLDDRIRWRLVFTKTTATLSA